MEKFVIEGRHRLSGEVIASGNKNAALPILAACLLTDQPVILNNVPEIRDVHTMKTLLESLGAEITVLAPNKWQVHARNQHGRLDPMHWKNIRGSILLPGDDRPCGDLT